MIQQTPKTYCSALIFLFSSLSMSLWGQDHQPATAIHTDTLSYQANWQQKKAQAILACQEEVHADAFASIYEERYSYLSDKLRNGHFLFEASLTTYLDSLLKKLQMANPEIAAISPEVLIGRYAAPNAVSLGDGTIILNIGLLRRLTNEEELLFVLAHEIAHVHLSHLETRLRSRFAASENEINKKELRRLVKEENREGLLDWLQGTLYDQRRHSREHECAADSVALVLLSKAGFSPKSAWDCLSILDSIDREKYPTPLALSTQLNTPAYPFKERWLAKPDLMFGGSMTNEEEAFWDVDSLRTHPACQERIALLKRQAATIQNGGQQAGQPLLQWQLWADYEMILGLMHFRKHGPALYHSLKLSQQRPDDPFLHLLIGRCLNQIYSASLVHQFDDEVPPPRTRPEEDWQELMTMLRKMRSREILHLAKSYLEFQQGNFPDYVPLAEELKLSENLLSQEN